MSEKDKSIISKSIYDFFSDIYHYENFIKKQDNLTINGYLIDLEQIKELKKNILYDSLQSKIKDFLFQYENMKNIIEKDCRDTIIERKIIQTKFGKADDLIKCLEEKKFYFINEGLWKKICKNENIEEEKGVSIILNKNLVILIFKDKTELYFEKKDDCIIEKSRLIQNLEENKNMQENKTVNDTKDINNPNNINNRLGNSSSQKEDFNIKFKDEIKILIKLIFYYEKFNENLKNSKLIEENKKKIYLIDKDWIERFKTFFLYKEIKDFLKNNKCLNGKNNFDEKENKNDKLIEDIISSLPDDLKNKIKAKNNIEELKQKHEYKTKTLKVIKNNRHFKDKELKFLINFEFINYHIYDLLKSNQYLDDDLSRIKECQYYYINGKNILMKMKTDSNEEYNDEIGYIDDDNFFVHKYVLDYDKKINDINSFISENFEQNFKNENNYYEIREDNNIIGYYYKIDVNTNIININNNEQNEIKNEGNTNKFEKQENDKKLFSILEKEICILISIYFYYKSLEESISNSLKEDNKKDKNQIIEEKCYLINQIWIDKFKTIFGYNKLWNYIEEQKLNKENENIIIRHIYDLLKKEKRFLNKDEIQKEIQYFSNLPIIPKINNCNKNNYPDQFYIISEEIYEKINKSIFCSKNYEKQKEKYYFLDNGQIILKLGLISLNNNESQYNILLIGKINNDHLFIPEKLINYEKKNNDKENLYYLYEQMKNIKNFFIYTGDITKENKKYNYNITNLKYSKIADTNNKEYKDNKNDKCNNNNKNNINKEK